MTELSPKPRIALGADHAGYHIKEIIRQFLENAGYPVDDLGTWSEESVDYPDYAKAVADRVAAHQDAYGIAMCGTGMGMAIAANKVPGIRAAVAHNVDTARLAREHNDANVLTMGGRVVNGAQAIEMVQTFLNTTFAGGRHGRRVEKIIQIEAAERG
ncbi:MAG: ribose 5-phosphate isomerase B [Candidatus Acidiferrum sp.]|jgi:ribose 5-phosphate isomerase B